MTTLFQKIVEDIEKEMIQKKWSYPEYFQALHDHGITGYYVSWADTPTRIFKRGEETWTDHHFLEGYRMSVADSFSKEGLVNSLKSIQQGHLTYLEWAKQAASAGVSHYDVCMKDRTVTYHSKNNMHYHIEQVPERRPCPARFQQLQKGHAETRNLMEMLSVDIKVLLHNTFPDIALPSCDFPKGITKKMAFAAQVIHEQSGMDRFDDLARHPSDILRGIGCYLMSHEKRSFHYNLQCIRGLADDHNSGVREWAWMALRPSFVEDVEKGLELLLPWTESDSPYLRRFASEITRPRGVWCAHIRQLRQQPWQAQPLLHNLYADPARYVQLSVGNWLNDAGKDHPDWVKNLCHEWENTTHNPTTTAKICKRALRRLTMRHLLT